VGLNEGPAPPGGIINITDPAMTRRRPKPKARGRPSRAPSGAAALKRTRALIETQLAALERGEAGDPAAAVRALSQLLKLIDQVKKLERIDAADRRARRKARAGTGEQEMRDALARRIEGLAALDAEAGDQRPDAG
jgi:hypothetical protein